MSVSPVKTHRISSESKQASYSIPIGLSELIINPTRIVCDEIGYQKELGTAANLGLDKSMIVPKY